jgi:SAM-dependent methyltransferase
MDIERSPNSEQATLWNGTGGQAWVEAQATLDRMFEPFAQRLMEPLSAGAAARVLDIGCGAGGTTMAAARLLGPGGRCVGIDISQALVDAARTRAERQGSAASFIRADAQTHAFEPAAFDLLISRFGVMFFDDSVGAFANLRRAASRGAEFRFVAWRSPAENPFMTAAERSAAPFLPEMPPRKPDAPGQFAFADRRRVVALLEQGGWGEVDVQAIDVVCALPKMELERYFTRLGPVGRILQDTDERTRARVIDAVRSAFDPYVQAAEVRFTAACWLASARER